MNILMIPTWYFDENNKNSGIFTVEQSIELKKSANVAIFYPYDTSIDETFSVKEEKSLLTFRYKPIKISIPLIGKFINIINILYYFKKIKREFKPDILHAHVSTQAGYITRILSKVYRIPYVVTEHSPRNLLISNIRDEKRAVKVFRDSKAAISVSNSLTRSLYDLYKLDTIYNGILVERDLIDFNSIKSTNINIAFVASFYNLEIKGFEYLFKSINILKDKYENVLVHLVGDGEYINYYKQYVNKIGIDDEIIFYGYKDKNETLSIINKCDFLVSASIVETFGISIAEALILGKPVVITNSGGPEEFVNEKCGFIVKKQDEVELAKGIEKMILNYSYFDSENIKKYAENLFSIEKTTDKYLKLYKNILKSEV